MGDGSEEEGREGAMARCRVARGYQGFLSVTTATIDEFEAALVASVTTTGGRSRNPGRFFSVIQRDGHTAKRAVRRSRELDNAAHWSVDAQLA